MSNLEKLSEIESRLIDHIAEDIENMSPFQRLEAYSKLTMAHQKQLEIEALHKRNADSAAGNGGTVAIKFDVTVTPARDVE